MSRCLDINFGYLDNTVAATTAATAALDARIADCTGVRNKLSRIKSDTSNLYTANTYLDKKRNELREKRDNLRQFNKDVIAYGAYAKAQDVKTAAAIHISGHKFYHREGLAHGALYTIAAVISDGVKWLAEKAKNAVEGVIEGCKKLWKNIKDFYEKNKYWIDVVVDVFCVVAAVVALFAATGPLALLAAVWGLLKATTSLVYDTSALGCHIMGDDIAAEALNGKGLKEVFKYYLGDKWGGIVYTGLDIAVAVCNIANLFQKASEFDKTSFDSIKEMKLEKKKILLGFDGTSQTDALKRAKQFTGNVKFLFSLPRNILRKGIFEGTMSSISSTKDAFSVGKGIPELITTIAQ